MSRQPAVQVSNMIAENCIFYLRFYEASCNRIFKEFPRVATVEIEKTISHLGYLLALVCVVFLLQRESAKKSICYDNVL